MSATRRRRTAVLATPAFLALFALAVTLLRAPAGMVPAAAATMTVAQAISGQGGTGTVRGYVVGEAVKVGFRLRGGGFGREFGFGFGFQCGRLRFSGRR